MRSGIDIGGTKAVVALVDDSARIVRSARVATGADMPCRTITQRVADTLKELAGQEGLPLERIAFTGIGVPGTVDAGGRIVRDAPNLGWRDEPVARYFSEACGIMPALAQDTRAAALAEARTKQMKDRRCVACITLGTGIGCGVVIDGRIWHGALGTAGEIGHIPVVPGGRKCACGRCGCMEAYASGTGIARTARERGLADSCEQVFALAEGGDLQATQLLDEAVSYAAMGICAMINVLSPDAVLFSGGLSGQAEFYVEPLMERIRSMAYRHALDGMYLGTAFLGPDAPAIGAAFLDLQPRGEEP